MIYKHITMDNVEGIDNEDLKRLQESDYKDGKYNELTTLIVDYMQAYRMQNIMKKEDRKDLGVIGNDILAYYEREFKKVIKELKETKLGDFLIEQERKSENAATKFANYKKEFEGDADSFVLYLYIKGIVKEREKMLTEYLKEKKNNPSQLGA